MKVMIIVIVLLNVTVLSFAQTILAAGDQPQVTVGKDGTIRLVYGEGEKIYYAVSTDNGVTFGAPKEVAEIKGMHLGMTRGPQLATSKDYSMVTAMDKNGNIHSFRLSHNSGKWTRISNVNDSEGSAPEGLMSIAADDKNHFYAVWLDLREDRQNNICFSTSKDYGLWTRNTFVYKSPDGHVCECCKPSIVVRYNRIAIMFRNCVMGSRDLYLITSSDNGNSFTSAQKLGTGTWPLKACPMDGGGLSVSKENYIHTAWQRDGQVFFAVAGQPEVNLGSGRGVGMNGDITYWQRGEDVYIKTINGEPIRIGQGTALSAVQLSDGKIFAVWQRAGQIVFKKDIDTYR